MIPCPCSPKLKCGIYCTSYTHNGSEGNQKETTTAFASYEFKM